MLCDMLPVAVGFVSGAIVAFIGHIFAARRETLSRRHTEEIAKEARKRNFVSFADGFRAEVERSYPVELSEVFPARIYRFREETAKIRGDISLSKQEEFARLVTVLCKLTDDEVKEVDPQEGGGIDYVGRKRVTEAIDAIVRFVG